MKKWALLLLVVTLMLSTVGVSLADTWTMQEVLMKETLPFNQGTYYDLTAEAIVVTYLDSQWREYYLRMEKSGSVLLISADEVAKIIEKLPELKAMIELETRGNTEYKYTSDSGIELSVLVGEKSGFVFKLLPTDNSNANCYEIKHIDELLEFLKKYDQFFKNESSSYYLT